MAKETLVQIDDTLKYYLTLIKSPSLSRFSGHSHNLYELIYFESGDATYVVEDKKYKLRSGDLIITRPSKYHFIRMDSQTDYERHNILFDHKRLGIDMRALPEWLDVINLERGGVIDEIFKKFSFYAESFSKTDFCNIAKLLIQEIIYNLSLAEEGEKNRFSVLSPILSRALEYIGENLFTIKDVSEVAGAVFVTDSYLFRLFKRELFKTPKKYITEKRLLAAQKLIRKGKNPTEASETCGFDDYTTFYRNYVELFGKKPSEEIGNKK